VRSVARAHDIPSNQLFHWRKLYREGLLGNQAEQAPRSKLVAVRLVSEQQQRSEVDRQAPHEATVTASLGTIQLETEKGRLSIYGAADPAILQVVLERWLG
jgi:transposase-like protein